jgi:hypothetical protein
MYSLFALTLLAGCYEDRSSDRYDPAGVIEITGIESSYTKTALVDVLEIKPVVTSTDPSDNVDGFEYHWTCHTSLGAIRDDGKGPVKEWHTKDIVWPLDVNADGYTLILQVTDPATGYSVYRTTSLQVNTSFSVGFYFLKETGGGDTELDFHSPDGAITARDLLAWQFGAPIDGAPTSLSLLAYPGGTFNCYPYMDLETGELFSSPGTPALAVMGGRDMKVMRISDMTQIYDYDQLFFSGTAPDEKPVNALFMGMMANTAVFTEKGFYHGARPSSRLSFPIAPAGTSLSKVTKLSVMTPVYAAFDEGNGQFLYYAWGGTQTPLSSTNQYSPTGIDCRALFMGTDNNADFNSGRGWAILEERSDPSKRHIYRLIQTATEPITDVRTIPSEFEFNTAQVYGNNKGTSTQMLYGGVGDKFYIYNTGNDTETRVSPAGIGSGETITMITHRPGIQNPSNGSTPPLNGYMVVATHKEGNYKVYVYDMVGGVPDGNPVAVYTGAGKVVDMQYAGGTNSYSPIL